jgi:hypothetical protein
MDQEVKYIDIKDLVLWTENPRDPIDAKATDQDIVDRALYSDNLGKWTLSKLSKEMGDYYDFSELPTVVYHGKKPIVYDGNRRIILGKIKHNLVTLQNGTGINIPDFPEKIPCNVCSKDIALKNIYRKHSETGSWLPLERDIFLHKFMGKEKSSFLVLEEQTGIIGQNPHLNQRFVKDEIFKDEALKSLGFSVQDGKIHSVHKDQEALNILSDISEKIKNKEITTRKKRGKIIEVLDPSSQKIIDQNKKNISKPFNIIVKKQNQTKNNKILSTRPANKGTALFGGKLYLKYGNVSDLYRDIDDLYQFYIMKKDRLSDTFCGLIRMSLRLLVETAALDKNTSFDNYLKNNFDQAKATLGKDEKTTLSNHNVTKNSIIQLLHTAAHSYTSSSNLDQTIAISIIVGAILSITHGKA